MFLLRAYDLVERGRRRQTGRSVFLYRLVNDESKRKDVAFHAVYRDEEKDEDGSVKFHESTARERTRRKRSGSASASIIPTNGKKGSVHLRKKGPQG